MKDLQSVADATHANAGHAGASAGALIPHGGPRSMSEVEAHTKEVARMRAARAQRFRNPRGTRYPADARYFAESRYDGAKWWRWRRDECE
jgi:hypothetical protein